jgi:glutaredoxin
MTKAIFYHAGCPVCVDAERLVAEAIDKSRYQLEVVHLGQNKARIAEAEKAGVKSVPALVLNGKAYHINFGASLADLRR